MLFADGGAMTGRGPRLLLQGERRVPVPLPASSPPDLARADLSEGSKSDGGSRCVLCVRGAGWIWVRNCTYGPFGAWAISLRILLYGIEPMFCILFLFSQK